MLGAQAGPAAHPRVLTGAVCLPTARLRQKHAGSLSRGQQPQELHLPVLRGGCRSKLSSQVRTAHRPVSGRGAGPARARDTGGLRSADRRLQGQLVHCAAGVPRAVPPQDTGCAAALARGLARGLDRAAGAAVLGAECRPPGTQRERPPAVTPHTALGLGLPRPLPHPLCGLLSSLCTSRCRQAHFQQVILGTKISAPGSVTEAGRPRLSVEPQALPGAHDRPGPRPRGSEGRVETRPSADSRRRAFLIRGAEGGQDHT